MDAFYERPIRSPKMKSVSVPFGIDLKADLYLPVSSSGKLPVVVMAPPFLVQHRLFPIGKGSVRGIDPARVRSPGI
jgi:hypothetical protein